MGIYTDAVIKPIPLNNPSALLVVNKRFLNIGNEIIGSITFLSMRIKQIVSTVKAANSPIIKLESHAYLFPPSSRANIMLTTAPTSVTAPHQSIFCFV
ncbi:hypothetical protein D3C85_1132420 [compost metagenome]